MILRRCLSPLDSFHASFTGATWLTVRGTDSGQGGGGGIFSRNILSVHVEAVIYILVWLNNSLLENRKRMNMKVSI